MTGRDVTLAECRRILRQAHIITGSRYSLEADGDSGRYFLVSHPDGYQTIAMTEPMSAQDCLAFLLSYIAALEFSANWQAGGGHAVLQ